MAVTAVLCLPPLTRSIAFRPYLASIGSQPILRRLAENILEHSAIERLIILYHYDAERQALEEALRETKAELYKATHYSELQAVAEIASQLSDGQVAFVDLCSAFAPGDLLSRMICHHRTCKNSFTLLDGAPAGLSLSVLEMATLRTLLEISGHFSFFSVENSLRRLLLVGEQATAKFGLSMHSVPFNLSALYNEPLHSLPLDARFTLPGDAALFAQAATRVHATEVNTLSMLLALKNEKIKQTAKLIELPESCHLPRIEPQPARPRVLYLALPSAFSGAEQALCSMIKFIDHARFDLFAITGLEGVFSSALRTIGAQVITPGWECATPCIESFTYALQLLRTLSPDIMHLNGGGALPFIVAAKILDIPIVQHVRNADLNGFHDGIVSAKAIIAITDYLKRETLRFPVSADHVHVIYDEVDSEQVDPKLFDRAECRREFGIDAETPVALMVARVVPNKRYDLVIQAAALIRQQLPGFRLILKGDVYDGMFYSNTILSMIHELGLEQTVRWIDFVPDIHRLMAASDVLVLCSDHEGLGSCVVEAMSMELPVVVTNTGGTHEIVQDGVSGGFVVPGSDAKAIAERVLQLLSDKELRRKLGTSGRSFVQTHLDARISACAMMKIYDNLLQQHAVSQQQLEKPFFCEEVARDTHLSATFNRES